MSKRDLVDALRLGPWAVQDLNAGVFQWTPFFPSMDAVTLITPANPREVVFRAALKIQNSHGHSRAAGSGVDKSSHGDFPSSTVNFCAALTIRVATFARTSAQASTMSSLLSRLFSGSRKYGQARSRSLSSNWNWRRCSASSLLRASIWSAGRRYFILKMACANLVH